jgi:hypothetical protein
LWYNGCYRILETCSEKNKRRRENKEKQSGCTSRQLTKKTKAAAPAGQLTLNLGKGSQIHIYSGKISNLQFLQGVEFLVRFRSQVRAVREQKKKVYLGSTCILKGSVPDS